METTTEPPQVRHRPTLEQRRNIREAYIKGKGSIRVLCQQFNLSFGTVQDWSDAENWPNLRKAFYDQTVEKLVLPTKAVTTSPEIEFQPATTQAGKLAIVEAQLEKVDALIDDCEKVSEITTLAKAKEILMNQWALLTGFERPGVRRAKRTRQPIQDIQPIPAMIEPVPVVPSKPLGWEYD